MAAAAAGRKWWAAFRHRLRLPVRALSGAKAQRAVWLALASCAALMAVGVMIGIAVNHFDERRAAAERHAALRTALDAFGIGQGDGQRIDGERLTALARAAGLSDLRYDAEVPADAAREVQSLHDANGRIIGWFSWTNGAPLIRAVDALWGIVGLGGLALAVAAAAALYVARRLAGALKRSRAAVRRLTREDALTGLPNQRTMLARLDAALVSGHADVVVFALLDPDGFQEVNETLGRAGGDAVVKAIAEHLQAGLPAGAQLGRFAEDEFAVIMASKDGDAATVLMDALRRSLPRQVFMERPWPITAGIGLAQAPEDGTSGEEVVRRAGLALRAAKRQGRGAALRFVPQIEREHAERRFLLRELEAAVAQQAFDVYYQPIVAAEGGAIIGVEALLRWTHPTRGAIPPTVFIPLAEQSGMMAKLGEIVLSRALADAARWPHIFVAVNVSPVQIRDRWFVALVDALLAETGIAASRAVLEVTEGVFIDDPQETQARLKALRALGVGIALDDFGTGYSSLSYLQQFPFDRVKIDRTFVASLGRASNASAIIQSVVTLGHALGMKVLAEGVETEEQRVLARLAGCDEMQGHLFATAGPAAAIDRALARIHRAAAG
jgi:diguanylate cyclase (GGDEF)-like protein